MTGYGFTNKGIVRTQNQDGIFLSGTVGLGNAVSIKISCDKPGLFFVADGVGSVQDGSYAVRKIMEYALNYAIPTSKDELQLYLKSMNGFVFNQASKDEIDTASTIVGILFLDNVALSFNIGDSPAFSLNNGFLQTLSIEDTIYGLTGFNPDESTNVKPPLLQYVGKQHLETDFHIKEIPTPQNFLLCSDGLTDLVSIDDMEDLMADTKPADAIRKLYHEAMAQGGNDNISIIYLES